MLSMDDVARVGTLQDRDIIVFLNWIRAYGGPEDPKEALEWALKKVETHQDQPSPKNFSSNA